MRTSRAVIAHLLTLICGDIELHWHGLTALRIASKYIMSRPDPNKPGLTRFHLTARIRRTFERKRKQKASIICNVQLRRRQRVAGGAGGRRSGRRCRCCGRCSSAGRRGGGERRGLSGCGSERRRLGGGGKLPWE